MERKIRIAIPSKGRLKQPSVDLLRRAGIDIPEDERDYVFETSDPRFEAVFARAFDIPVYVQGGAVDIGMTGHDLILEREADVNELLDLKFGKCKIIIATPEKSPIRSVNEVPGAARVATEFPKLTGKYFDKLGKQVEILEVRGASELAPALGLAQFVVSISETGETLRKRNLKVIGTILESTCRLACNRIIYRTHEFDINELVNRLVRGGLTN
jgi:ATP phosphoribosyltransferase